MSLRRARSWSAKCTGSRSITIGLKRDPDALDNKAEKVIELVNATLEGESK